MAARRPIPKQLWRIAHRGARDEAPENTLVAFERALRYPVDGIEFDVQMSRDGVLVIHHDETLKRLTGHNDRVADATAEFLRRLDWGGWYGQAFAGEPLPTLDAALAALGGRTRLFIEIKSFAPERRSGHVAAATEKVLDLLDTFAPAMDPESVAVLSFDPEVLSQAHQRAPRWRYMFNLPEKEPNTIMTMPETFLNRLWAVDVAVGRLSIPMVQWAKSRGLAVLTYTCNTVRQVQKAVSMGLDGVISDKPGWLCRDLIKTGGFAAGEPM